METIKNKNSDPLVLDINHWRLNDKSFQEERKAKWPMIEEVLSICWSKNKKAINIIKKYYLKGELPDWQALNDATEPGDRMFRHLDIATFLWLHPSSDLEVLLPLTKAYYAGYGRLPQDIQAGMYFLFEWGVPLTIVGRGDWKAKCPCFEGKGRLIFNLIYHEIEGNTFFMEVKGFYRTETHHQVSNPSLSSLELSTKWLCSKKLSVFGSEMILQYSEVTQLMFKLINSNPSDVSYWFKENLIYLQELYFYRIANFDIEQEGDTPRTQYVNLVRKILDEDDHSPEIKNLWAKIKNNEITVKNPWKL